MSRQRSRGQALQAAKEQEIDFLKQAIAAMPSGNLIPIIGDTIRNERIFDPDNDKKMGIGAKIKEHLEAENVRINFDRLNITEELACFWVKKINEEAEQAAAEAKQAAADAKQGNLKAVKEMEARAREVEQRAKEAEQLRYPLADSYNLARVAQFLSLIKGGKNTKEDYLTYLKNILLDEMYEAAEANNDREEMAYITHLGYEIDEMENSISFSEIVTELDLPRNDDPVRMLAQLNLSLYITTSYYDFIEREIEASGRKPRSRLCHWSNFTVKKEHQEDDEEPTQDSPVVYHLFGMEQYPESMVLSEDDHLDLLWELAWNAKSAKKNGESIIPNYIGEKLNSSSHPLLLLGYRLHDWDLRVVLRGLLRERIKEKYIDSKSSIALQIDIEKQPLVRNVAQATAYLKEYYDQACLDVEFGDATEFVKNLTSSYYKRYRNG